MQKSRSFQRVRDAIPHRLNWAFYMTGEPTPLFEKQDISPEDLHMFRQLTLHQNHVLFFGSGIQSGAQPKEAARFERNLRQAIVKETANTHNYEEQETELFDVGRYSRMSRTKTPGSPIPEETLGDLDTPPSLPSLQETFLTENPQQ